MSLINEALKKAQRQRTDEPASLPGAIPGQTVRIEKRSQPRSANSMLLLAAGAFMLVVLSVVITVYLVNRPAKPATVAKAPAPKIEPPVVTAPSSTPISAPIPSPATATAVPPPSQLPAPAMDPARNLPQPAPKTAVVAPNPAPNSPPSDRPSVASNATVAPAAAATATPPPATVPASPATAAPAANTPLPSASAPAAVNTAAVTAKPDERIHAFVDAMRITAVKAAGADSRVMMNDRVYRVNDIIERTLGVRLIKVEANSLTLSDGNGVTYIKYF